MSNLTKLLMAGIALCMAFPATAVEVEDYYKDYSAKAFDAYVMDYTPTFTAEGWQFSSSFNLVEKTGDETNDAQYDGCEIVSQNNKEYFKTTTDKNPWIQFFASDGITAIGGQTYKISIMVKGTNPGNIKIVANWGWDEGQSTSDLMAVSEEWAIQTVELTPTNDSFTIIMQPGNTGNNVYDIKWISITHEDESLDADFLCMKIAGLSPHDNSWDQTIDFEFPDVPAGNYIVKFDVYADAGIVENVEEFQILPNGEWEGNWRIYVNPTPGEWVTCIKHLSIDQPFNKLSFFIGKFRGTTVYLDNFSVVAEGTTHNLLSNGDFAISQSRGWSKPGWHSQTLAIVEGPGHYVATEAHSDWFTFCCNKAVKSFELTPYKAVSVNGEYITLMPIDGPVPANTGVMLIGDGVAHDLLVTVEEPDALSENLLKPAFANETILASAGSIHRYVFGTQNEKTGFFHVTKDLTVPADKNVAYLEITVDANKAPQFISLEGGQTTMILNVNNDENINGDDTVYNLQGMRVDKHSHGLYIVNGKKVIY